MREIAQLLPTTTTKDADASGGTIPANKTLTDAVVRTGEITLLPTPVAQPSGNTPEDHLRKKPGREVVTDLAIIAENGLIGSGGRLLPTPGAYDGDRGGSQHPDKRRAGGHSVTIQDAVEHLTPMPRASHGGSATETMYGLGAVDDGRAQGEVTLLPTPTVGNATGGNAQRGGDRGDERLLPGLATDAAAGRLKLLPTPNTMEHLPVREGEARERAFKRGDMNGSMRSQAGNLRERVVEELAEPVTDWGPYATAIARAEHAFGRPAPAPVRFDGKGDKARLNPELTEWMMGWPAGHVTDPAIQLTRAEQLKACGNGVVPQQAAAALRILLARPGVPSIEVEF